VLRGAQRAYDTEETRVTVGEDDGCAAVPGDTAGGQRDAAEPDALGVGRQFGKLEMVWSPGDERGRAEGRAGGAGQRRTVPPDHGDAVGHR
jgi:hypothetical protein